jgi:hypothetical protein
MALQNGAFLGPGFAVRLNRDNRPTGLELFLVYLCFLVGNTHPGERSSDTASSSATENSSQCANCDNRSNTGNEPGCCRAKDSTEDTATEDTRTGLFSCFRIDSRVGCTNRAVLIIRSGEPNLALVVTCAVKFLDCALSVCTIAKNANYGTRRLSFNHQSSPNLLCCSPGSMQAVHVAR